MTALRIPRSLRLAVRSRVQLGRVTARNRRAYAVKVAARAGHVLGRNAVGIDGATYPAAGLENLTPGAAVKVVNVGSPASALYRPATGGSVAGITPGSRSASTTGGATSEGGAGASLLADLGDTTIAADPDAYAPLIWDATTAKWIDGDPGLHIAGLLREVRYGADVEDADLPVELVADGDTDATFGVWAEWFVVADPDGDAVATAGSAFVAAEGSVSIAATGDTLDVAVAADGSVALDGVLTVAHRLALRMIFVH